MKKVFLVSFIVILLIVCTFGCTPSAPSASPEPTLTPTQTFKWRMQSSNPAGDPGADLLKDYANYVSEHSNGRLQIQAFSEGEIVVANEMYQAIAANTFEIGDCSSSQVVPIGEFEFGLPMMRSTPVTVETYADENRRVCKWFLESGIADVFREFHAKNGLYWLAPDPQAPEILLTTKPIKTLTDFKGKKIKIYTVAQADFIAGLGGAPYEGSPADTYQELMLGTIDGTYWDVTGITGLKYHEVAPYSLLGIVQNVPAAAFYVNLNTWNSLPSDLQEILKAGTDYFNELKISAYLDIMRDVAEKEAKGEVIPTSLDSATIDKAKQVAVKIWEEYGKKDEYCAKALVLAKEFAGIK